MITVDNGTEFASKAMDLWAYKNGVHLDFIRPGKPVENGSIESFNGKLRDECLNVEVFFTLADARRKLHLWRRDYNHHRPHSALDDRTPFAARCSSGKDGGEAALENAARFPLSHRMATAGILGNNNNPSTRLLEGLTGATLTAILPVNPAQTEPRRPKSPTKFASVSRSRSITEKLQLLVDGDFRGHSTGSNAVTSV